MNKFEQLIEYVINNEESKARELFHEIVVEKSRVIYEEMMQEEENEDLDEAESEELDEAEDEGEELDENMLGGDQADDLIDDVETEEEGISMEGDEEGMDDMGGDDMGDEAEENLEDRVVDLEDKLDELMAEFESLMGDEAGEEHMDGEELDDVSADDFGGDETDSEEVVDTEFETEGMFNENVSLKAVAKPSNTEEASQKKSPVAANSGARGAMAKPVHTGASEGGHHDSSAYKNTTKELIGKVGNTPAQSTQKPTPATKPNLGQAAGVNNKSVIK